MGYRFSIIVPVYNVEPYLNRCVQSILAQTYDSYEVLLIDDGSTDGSGKLCDQLAENRPFVSVWHKENGGISSARNFGMDHAAGEYLLFVDSDDYIQKDMLRKLDQVLLRQAESIDVIAFEALEISGKGECSVRRTLPEYGKTEEGYEYLRKRCQQRNMINAVWAYAYRTEFLNSRKLRFEEGIFHEDVEILPRILLDAKQVLSIPDVFYYYVIRENSISTRKNKDKNIRDLFKVLEEQNALADRQEPELKRWMKNAILDSYLSMVQEARMYRPEYRKYLKKRFLGGKAATVRNHFRAALCFVNVRWYCAVNDWYKQRKG